MLKTVATTFSLSHSYGRDEISIIRSTERQIEEVFAQNKNLLCNMTWFGPQFNNGGWASVEQLANTGVKFDNLFLLAIIDPVYITNEQIDWMRQIFDIKRTFKIGMWADSKYEWNFHAIVTGQHMPDYPIEHLLMKDPSYTFICYQRKPRSHRIEFTRLLESTGLIHRGIVTLGGDNTEDQMYGLGQYAPTIKIDDPATNYTPDGSFSLFGGVPNDLVSLGRLDLWQNHFLNVVSETEFNEWHPRFVTEKTWKPILGLRPFIIHGQRSIYAWLHANGFRTFNHYWPHVPVETKDDQHGNVLSVIEFLSEKSNSELSAMYEEMLPDLLYNKERYKEFAKEQKHKMENLFQ